MKYITALTFVVIVSVTSATEPAKVAAIKEVLELADARAVLEQMRLENVVQTRALLISNVGAKADDPLMKRVIEKAMTKYDAYSKEFMGWEPWESQYIIVYDELFTAAELKGLADFYRTPAGKAMIRALPQIGSRMQKALFQQNAERQAKIDSIVRQSINEVRTEEAMK